jgi:hypothetical protein
MSVEQLARCEFKYAVQRGILDRIRRELERYCVVDRTGVCDSDGYYTIDSLYFDTPNLDFFRESYEERPVRRKLRVRAYPDTPGSIVKIEVKRRIHELILKTSLVVPYQGWQSWLEPGADGAVLKSGSREALATFVTLQRHLHAEPKILVRYSRVAFHSTIDNHVRITFDRRMAYQAARSLDLLANPRRWAPLDSAGCLGSADSLLMEVKFRNRAPLWVGDLIRRFGLVRRGFSKYGMAIRLSSRETVRCWDLAPAWSSARSEASQWIS